MCAKNQKGVGLIEVLITAFIMAVGLLGLAALQTKSLQYNHGAYLRSQATISSYDIIDRMRINRTRALAGDYNVAYGIIPTASTSLSSIDLNQWKSLLSQTLPSGDGQISCSSASCAISIRWSERGGADTAVATGADATSVPVEFTYTTRL